MKIVNLFITLFLISGNSVSTEYLFSNHAPVHASIQDSVIASPDVISSELEAKYPGFVHKDRVALFTNTYEVYYWNTGEFYYTQFVITKNQRVVFDSKKAGLRIQGGFNSTKEKGLWVQALVQNSKPTFKFELADNRPELATLVIEEIDNILRVTVNDNVAVEFEDIDHDGSLELISYPFLGEMPLGPAEVSVYEWKKEQYVPNLLQTQQYWENELSLREQRFKDTPNENSLDSLLSAYLLLDRMTECINRFPIYYEWANQTVDQEGYVSVYKQLINDKAYAHTEGWMKKAQPLRKQKT
ncbi:hypothetical protein [Paenibacillus monticola]|uniref:Uncharacterized protein n=1 Tax=Paenibacillus monticola TaxID=2666075 RepID=A0A7X2H464_9BACL|nr:hypothetical protein [Paenibacillus monticola]MRN52398.1 hypothetical protein [Paenibacillus monticola]